MRRSALSLLLVLLGGCPAPRPPAPTAIGTVPSASSVSTSPSAPASASASAVASVSVSAPTCLASADVVGWDEAHDEITLCTTKGTCVALGVDAKPRATSAPTAPLSEVDYGSREWSGDAKIVAAGARVQLATTPKKWAPVPFSATKEAQLLWLSKDETRALVLRIEDPLGNKPNREHVDLVDLAKHASLAHGVLCNYEIHTGASTDDAETVAVISFGHANPIVLVGVIDLTRNQFVPLGTKSKTGYEGCGPDDFGKKFETEESAGLFDATRRRVGRALVSVEGKIVARLDGDFPAEPSGPGIGFERAKQIDASRRVVVRTSSSNYKQSICAGVMRIVPSSTEDGPPLSLPRCIPLCVASSF